MARFIADQRTNYRVPHTVVCALLGVSVAWFYKWLRRAESPGAVNGLHTPRERRRDTIDRAVKVAFGKARGLHGSPRLVHDLRDAGWTVSEKTVADSMRRQGLVARRIKHRSGHLILRSSSAAAKSRRLQNVVGSPQLLDLALQLGDPPCLGRRGAPAFAGVDLGLGDPVAQRLRVDPQLITYPTQSPGPRRRITSQIDCHLDRSLPKLLGILPRCCHDSHPLVG
ncbi:hypothetical protein BJ993_004923 [Nocardioides aromaticivorans]|uniref:HTH-like domain-containing protein n=1 Tax=Nocardioides aromaticivorans TaxID=200618 RepID=A0A7Z0CRD2_9ACTN|nr:IS3 family transposase [Nocardioides aromaticivorans]NYI47777.1 hypothetical protein [Nocardioides aromaticivorans]